VVWRGHGDHSQSLDGVEYPAYTFFHDESHFHSDMMQIAVERGLPALAAWLWFVIAYLIFLLRLIRKTRHAAASPPVWSPACWPASSPSKPRPGAL